MSQYHISYELTAEEYLNIRHSIGARTFPLSQAREGLNHTYHLCCYRDEEDNPVAMARLLWDQGYVAYISDVLVIPQCQRQGLGKLMVKELLNCLRTNMKPGYKVWITLLAAKGKEDFYKNFGFETRPNEHGGSGMSQWIEKSFCEV